MKRILLADRVVYLAEKLHQLEEAAHALVKATNTNPVSRYDLDHARRDHQRRAIDYGLACARYLGGKTK